MAKLKAWSGHVVARRDWDSRKHNGERSTTVEIAVMATSRKAAAAALTASAVGRVTEGYVRDYMNETGNRETLDALAHYPPETVLIHADGHGTVRGREGWVPADGPLDG